MTVRTYYYQVFLIVVCPILIFMMNTQNIWMFIITAYFALFNHTPSQHHLSDSAIFRCKYCFFSFINTSSRAIFSFFARRVEELRVTVMTGKFFRSFIDMRSMIAFFRAIFSLINARRNMSEFLITKLTIRGDCGPFVQPFTS